LKQSKSFILAISALSVAINIVLGTLVQFLKIPLVFLDTIGTILSATLFGPFYGFMVGAVSNILSPILSGNPKDIPFFIVNAMVGLIVGLIAKKFKFNIKTAVITGIILSIACPLVGTPIVVYVYGGVTGSVNDIFFTILKSSGAKIFSSAFIPRVGGNIVDKILSCVLVSWALTMTALKSKYEVKTKKIEGI